MAVSPQRSRVSIAVAVIWIVALHGILLWLAFRGEARGLVGDEYGYLVATQRLLASGELVLDPLWPPLYPWLLAPVFWLGGEPMRTLAFVQTLLLGVAALSLHYIVAGVLGSAAAGRRAALMMLGYPTLAAFAHYAWPEVIYLALFLGACALLVQRPESAIAACAAGLLLAGALLCKLVLWPFLPLVVLPLLVHPSRRSTYAAGLVLAIATTLVVVVAPILRPKGAAARLDTNIAFNVLVGLRDTSRRSFVDPVAGSEYRAYLGSADDPDERTRILWSKVEALVAQRGTLGVARDQLAKQYVRLFDPESFLTAQLPGGALEASPSGYRGVPPRLATGLRAATWATYFVLLALAVYGVARRPWRHATPVGRAWMGVFGAFFVYNLAIFSVLHVVSRYRVALLPVLFLFAAAATERTWAAAAAADRAQTGPDTRP